MTKPRIWLLTTAFVVAPIVGLGIALFGLGHLTVRRSTSEADAQTDGVAGRANPRARGKRTGDVTPISRTGAEPHG